MDMPGALADLDASPLLLACVTACEDCRRILLGHATDRVATAPGAGAMQALRRRMLDCAELCAATANFAGAGSVFLPEMVAACTRLCDECGAACEALAPEAGLEDCIAACRRAASACFALSGRIARRPAPARRPAA